MSASVAFLFLLSIVASFASAAPAYTHNITITYFGNNVIKEGQMVPFFTSYVRPYVSLVGPSTVPTTAEDGQRKYYSLVMIDRDASKWPAPYPKFTFVHWWIADIYAVDGVLSTSTGREFNDYVHPAPHDFDLHNYDFYLIEQDREIGRVPFYIRSPEWRYQRNFEEGFLHAFPLGKVVGYTYFQELIFH